MFCGLALFAGQLSFVWSAKFKLDDLWTEASKLMTADVYAESVTVWVGDSQQPAASYGLFSISHGTLITVCRADIILLSAPAYYAADLLQRRDLWDHVEHMPR